MRDHAFETEINNFFATRPAETECLAAMKIDAETTGLMLVSRVATILVLRLTSLGPDLQNTLRFIIRLS